MISCILFQDFKFVFQIEDNTDGWEIENAVPFFKEEGGVSDLGN